MRITDTASSLLFETILRTVQTAEFKRQVPILTAGFAVVAERCVAASQTIALAMNEVMARPHVRAGLIEVTELLGQVHEQVAAIDAPGYTPYFERLGHSDLSARLTAGLIRFSAKKELEHSRGRRVALSALHDLAKRPRWHPALSQQLERLRQHCGDASFLQDAFDQAGCPALRQEFLDLLRDSSGGDHRCGPRVMAIAARIAPYAPSPRGRLPRPETVLHQTFLRWSGEAGGRQAYTYGLVKTDDEGTEDFLDEATRATRIELRRSSFNPVAARRAERKRRSGTPKPGVAPGIR